jgi:hypothetical protein
MTTKPPRVKNPSPYPAPPTSELARDRVDPAKVASPDMARDDMVRFTGSGYTPVRHVFVQKHGGTDRSSMLGQICKNKKRRALILYLMLLTLWNSNWGPLRPEIGCGC